MGEEWISDFAGLRVRFCVRVRRFEFQLHFPNPREMIALAAQALASWAVT
jgi:hypothetical protein